MSALTAERLAQHRSSAAGESVSLPARPGHGEPGAAVARNALFLVAGQAATTALAVAFSAALGRTLGAKDFGVFYLITTICTFAYVFVEWGQPLFVIRQAAREPPRSGELLGTALALRVVLALAVTIPAGLIAWALGYDAHTRWLSVFLILGSLPLFLAQAYGMVFRARDQMGRDAAVSVSNKAIALGVTLAALALGAGIPGVILAQTLAGVAALGVAVKLHRQLGTPPPQFSWRAARELLAAGAPILAMTAAAAVQPYLDAILLSKLAPAAVVGWFGAAKIVLGTLMAPAMILAAASYPRFARASADTAALQEQVRSALRPLLWLAALAATGTYLFATAVIGLIYGGAFGPAATILQAFAPGFFLLFIDILLGHIIYASGRGTAFAIAKIASVVVGTALNLLLIPFFQERFGNGGIGVVVAFAVSELVVFAGAIACLRRVILEPALALDVARAVGAAALTILLFRLVPPLPPWAGIPLCVAAFAAASLALRLVTGRDLIVLRSLIRRRVEAPPAAEAVAGSTFR